MEPAVSLAPRRLYPEVLCMESVKVPDYLVAVHVGQTTLRMAYPCLRR